MNTDLKYYVKVYNNWLDDKLCQNTVEELNDINWSQHVFYETKTENLAPQLGDRELDISWDTISTNDKIMDRIWHAYDRYFRELDFHWFKGWTGFTQVRYNRYNENREMAEHCDHIHNMFDGVRKGIPTLTALGILNDDYYGGEFIMWGKEQIVLKRGDVVVFPSSFLYPHKVNPVSKGIRYSCVTWAY